MARRPNKPLTEYCSSFRAVTSYVFSFLDVLANLKRPSVMVALTLPLRRLSGCPYSLKQKGETRLY